MTPALTELEPKPVWKHFAASQRFPALQLKKQPRVTTFSPWLRASALSRYRTKWATPSSANPRIKAASRRPWRCCRATSTWCARRNEGTVFNFDTDGIQVRRDGDWLKAEGTTLGADNGVGVAAALAVMESTDIAHGPLEFVFTIDEETGLTGAAEFPGGVLKSKYFLNLDNEMKDTLCIGCAGGIKTTARRKIALQPAKGDAAFRIKVSGLKGGHSGIDIHKAAVTRCAFSAACCRA